MAATIKIKNSSTASAVPTSSDLVQGELAVNVTDKRVFTENASGTVVELGTNPSILTLPDGSASAPTLTNDGDTNTGIFFPAADTVGISTGGTERARVDSSGNLGLGTSTINNAVTTYRGAGVSNYIQFTNATTGTASTDGCLIGVAADDTSLRLRVLESASMIFSTNDTERMRLDASGNLGVGTSSPLQRLDVASSNTGVYQAIRSTSSGATNVALRIQDGTTGTGNGDGIYLGRTGAENYLWTYENEPWAFGTNNTERARIDSSGYFYVRTTTRRSSAVFSLDSTTGTTNGMGINASGTGSSGMIIFSNPNGDVGSISVSGSTTTYSTSSDYRLKENVAPMQNALAIVTALKPVTYNWKADGSNGQGFIAHELQAVVPDCVTGEKDAVDADGNPKYQGIDTSFLVATLTAAIQEQQALITSLTARITTLEQA